MFSVSAQNELLSAHSEGGAKFTDRDIIEGIKFSQTNELKRESTYLSYCDFSLILNL